MFTFCFINYNLGDITLFNASCSACLLQQLVAFDSSVQSQTVDWLVPVERISPKESAILSSTPEYFIDDIAEMLLFIAKYNIIILIF